MQFFSLRESKTIPLDIPEGYYVLVEMTTLAAFRISVTLRDAETKQAFFSQSRCSTNPLPPITSFYRCSNSQTELFIDIPQSAQMDLRMDSLDLRDKDEHLILRSIAIVGEDSSDEDYNDFLINISVMRSGY